MPIATLRTKDAPHRINLQGVVFEKGVPTPISAAMAKEIASGPDQRYFQISADKTAPAAKASTPAPAKATSAAAGAAGAAPEDQSVRLAAIRTAMEGLDDDDSNYTKSGLPDARVLTGILGWTVSSEERDLALRQDVNLVRSKRTFSSLEPLDTGDVDSSTDGAVEV